MHCHFTVIYALMELEYIIPMGQSAVYYESSGRLEWALNVQFAPVNSKRGFWIIHPSLLERLHVCLASWHQNLSACDRNGWLNDNSLLVYGLLWAHKNWIKFMIIVFSLFIWVILQPDQRLMSQGNEIHLKSDYIIQIWFILCRELMYSQKFGKWIYMLEFWHLYTSF